MKTGKVLLGCEKPIGSTKSKRSKAKQYSNRFSFDSIDDFRKATGVLRKENWRDNSSGNPPKGNEPGTFEADNRWLEIKIIKGEKDANKLLKSAKVKYKATYKEPMGYRVFDQGGYFD